MRTWNRLLLALLAGMTCLVARAAQPELTVFAASSLTDVMQQIGAAFTAETKVPVRFSFAASSALARQVESGAPAQVFVSADMQWMEYLAQRGLIVSGSQRVIAGNSLVLVAPATTAPRMAGISTATITSALGDRGRIAMGDPETVPAGRYAREALRNLGIWPAVSRRIVPADNVRTALNFVARGEAPLGIVYVTDARVEPQVKSIASFPSDSHSVIVYPAGVVTGAGPQGDQFLRFLTGPAAAVLLQRAGFLLPPVPAPGK